MYQHKNPYRELEQRIRQRDYTAVVEMQRDLEPKMVHMVRYTLRSRKATTPLARCILAEADRLPRPARAWLPDEEEGVVRHIARRVCATVIDRIRPQPSESFRPLETVCA